MDHHPSQYLLSQHSISCKLITWLKKCCNCYETKCCTCYYHPKKIELFWVCAIIYTLTTNNKRQHWDLILTAVSVSNMYIVHDMNDLDTYPSCAVHERDSVVARTTHVLLLMIYTSHNVIRACIAHMQLTSTSQNFLSDSTNTYQL